MAKVGRPLKITEEVIELLRQAYMVGASHAEAAAFANIGQRTLYDYLEKYPEFSQQTDEWRLAPVLKAKTTIVNKLSDVKNAQWYLERRAKKEYGQNVDVTTDGKALPTPILGGNSVLSNDSNTEDTQSQ